MENALTAKIAFKDCFRGQEYASRRKNPVGRARTTRRYYLACYGLTEESFNKLFFEQGESCAVCRTSTTEKWCIDHDHNCCPVPSGTRKKLCGKCTRGILCRMCNTRLGFFGDDITLLQKAVTYLSQYE